MWIIGELLDERLHQRQPCLRRGGARDDGRRLSEGRLVILPRELDETHQVEQGALLIGRLDAREGADLMCSARARVERQPPPHALLGRGQII